jgi:hypothetical protein
MKLKLALAMAAVAPAAFAQNFITLASSNTAPIGKFTALVGTINSATTLRGVALSPYEEFFVYCVGSASVSQTIQYRIGTRIISSSNAFNCPTTNTLVANVDAGAVGADNILISPTAGLTATNVVTNTIVKTPAIIR